MLLLLFISTGCGRPKVAQKPVPLPTLIGVSVAGLDPEQAKLLRQSMEEKAKDDNIKLLWQETEPAKQKAAIQKLLEHKLKALVVFFGDEKEALTITRQVKEKDVPLLAIGIMPANIPLDGFVGLDAYRVGQQQAQFLDEALQGFTRAKVLILKGQDLSFEEEMTRGNLDVLQKSGNYEVEVQEVAPGEKVSAIVAGHAYLEELRGLISHNPAWTEEIVSLLKDLALDDRVVTVGVGATPRNVQALKSGIHDGEVDVDPELLGSFAYAAAKELAREGQWHYEEKVTSGNYEVPVKYLPSHLISQENIFLLETRYQEAQGKEESGQRHSPEAQEQESGSGEQSGEQKSPQTEQNKAKVIIQTQEGKTMEIEVEGGVQKLEIRSESESKSSGGKQGAEQSGQGQ